MQIASQLAILLLMLFVGACYFEVHRMRRNLVAYLGEQDYSRAANFTARLSRFAPQQYLMDWLAYGFALGSYVQLYLAFRSEKGSWDQLSYLFGSFFCSAVYFGRTLNSLRPVSILLLGRSHPDLLELFRSLKQACNPFRVATLIDTGEVLENVATAGDLFRVKSHEDWRRMVRELRQFTILDVIDVSMESDPIRWELEEILTSGTAYKTVMIVGSSGGDEHHYADQIKHLKQAGAFVAHGHRYPLNVIRLVLSNPQLRPTQTSPMCDREQLDV